MTGIAAPAGPVTPGAPPAAGDVTTARGSGERARTGLDALVLVALVALAALLRLPGLDARGMWDSDQGRDLALVADWLAGGPLPLLGPPTSIGDFHHGVLYYWLLAPAAIVSDTDPAAIAAWLAILGLAAVPAAWLLGRWTAGPYAGHVLGLLAAVSPAAIEASVFVWNPSPLFLAAALACLGIAGARRSGRARWWALAAAGAMLASQLHGLGLLLVAAVAAAWAAGLRGTARGARRGHLAAGAAAAAIVVAGWLPHLASELATGFAEAGGIAAYLGEPRQDGLPLPIRAAVVVFRSLAWPLARSGFEAPGAGLAAVALVAVLGAAAAGRGADGLLRWAMAALAGSMAGLALAAPGLGVVVPGLPTDHYHAFLDPLVLLVAAAGVAALAATGRPAGRLAGGAALVALVAVAVLRWPPAPAPDGGWALARAAAERVAATTGGRPVLLAGIPSFKPADALGFPLARTAGVRLVTAGPAHVVVVCDPLFEPVVGLACGGPAEDAWLAAEGPPGAWTLADRFTAGSRRTVSVWSGGTTAAALP